MSPARDWPSIVNSMQREVDRLVSDLNARKPPSGNFAPRPWEPALDCFETAGEIVLLIELAGMKADEIEVSVQGSLLIVRGDRREPHQGARRSYHRMEIAWGPFERTFELPAAVDADAIKAICGDGILEITIPKTGTAERSVRIKG